MSAQTVPQTLPGRVRALSLSLLLAAFAISAVIIAGARGWPETSTQAVPPVQTAQVEASAFAQGESHEKIEVEAVSITPFGFERTEITRPDGPFILAVHNHSGERELVLQLSRVRGESVSESRIARGSRRAYQRINLPPGQYILAEANHPNWRCRITIAGR